ncbi:MAG: 4Fe-4S dicluster domain-containing protein [Pseudomonadota bacterium]
MATKEEFYSTRGRANLLRQALNSQEFASEDLKQTLDLCLSCKGCKSECPANVDMARFKAEFLHHYHSKKGVGLKTRLMRHYALMLRLGAKFPRFSNRLAKSTWLKKRLGVAKQRQLPVISSQSLKVWWNRHKNAQKSPNGQVILLCDIFTQYHEPQIAQAAIQFLEHNGYSITPIFLTDSPRLLISQGLLKPAKKALGQIIEHCYDLVKSGTNLIGLEPSELLTLRDEAIDLVDARDKMRTLGESAKLFEEFILQEMEVGKIDITQFTYKEQELIVHVHCHQKSLVGIDSSIQALKQLPGASVTALQTGCCGMSGAFGYEHSELSMKIGEMQLFPAIRQAPDNALIVATGTSCRHQIADGVATTALHPAQIFWNYMSKRVRVGC